MSNFKYMLVEGIAKMCEKKEKFSCPAGMGCDTQVCLVDIVENESILQSFNRPNFRPAFTLAEMMVVMLVLSIVMAASAPIITKRTTTRTPSIWRLTNNDKSTYYNGDSVLIGKTTVPDGNTSKLYVEGSISGKKLNLKASAADENLLELYDKNGTNKAAIDSDGDMRLDGLFYIHNSSGTTTAMISNAGAITGTSLSTNGGSISGGSISASSLYTSGQVSSSSLTTRGGSISGGAISGTSLNTNGGSITSGSITSNGNVTIGNSSTSYSLLLNGKPVGDGVPVGTVIIWPHSASPGSDWLKCDGSSFNTSIYPKLYNLLGSNSLPNYQGMFLRGQGSQSVSDSYGAVTHSSASLGAVQSDTIRNIVGSVGNFQGDYDYKDGWIGYGPFKYHRLRVGTDYGTSHDAGGYISFDASRAVPTANENRPVNIAVNYYIKAR